MDLAEVRTARRKAQKDIFCTIGRDSTLYSINELSAQGFSLLSPKAVCPYQPWETLNRIVISNGEGVEMIAGSGTVAHVTEFDALYMQVGVFFTKKTIDRTLSGTIRAPRHFPKVRLTARVNCTRNGQKESLSGIVRDFTATTARIGFTDDCTCSLDVGDEVDVLVSAREKVMIDTPAHVVRKREDSTEVILRFSDRLLDVARVETVSHVLQNVNMVDAVFESLEEYRLVSDAFKALVSDWQLYLRRLNRLLDQEEAKKIYRSPMEQEIFLREIEMRVFPQMGVFISRLNEIADDVSKEESPVYKKYFREKMSVYLRMSPLIASIIDKDLGYAGDYETIKQFFQDPYAGDSLFGKLINKFTLDLDAVTAHKDRIRFLSEEIETLYRKSPKRLSFLSLGAGPAEEVLRFVSRNRFDRPVRATLVDMDAFALADFSDRLQYLPKENFLVDLVNINLLDILKKRRPEGLEKIYDLTYCAGLFDYFKDGICRKLTAFLLDLTRPGGKVVVTNVHKNNQARHFMDYGGGWEIIHRDEKDFENIIPSGQEYDFRYDKTHTNIYAVLKVPHHLS